MQILGAEIKSIIFSVLLLAGISILLTGCFFGTPLTKTVTPVIRIVGIPDAAAVDTITLTATDANGEIIGETTLSSLTTIPGQISMALPPGNDITFDLVISMGGTGVITSYTGTVTSDITTGITAINISMGIESTKIMIPDANNNRIVQIDDMTGKGWTSASGTDLGFSFNTYFLPYDTANDQYGRIYIANFSASELGGILRITSITDTTPVPVLSDSGYSTAMTDVAVDTINDRIYGVTSNSIVYWTDYSGSLALGNQFIDLSASPENIAGIAVDNSGDVYLSGWSNTEPWIGKYSSSGASLKTYIGPSDGSAVQDITITNGELYATKSGGTARIDKFDLDLNFIGSYGTSGAEGVEGKFVGPHNFIAVMNKKLTIIDGADYAAQLVSIDNIDLPNWETYGSWDNSGNSVGFFKFYSNC